MTWGKQQQSKVKQFLPVWMVIYNLQHHPKTTRIGRPKNDFWSSGIHLQANEKQTKASNKETTPLSTAIHTNRPGNESRDSVLAMSQGFTLAKMAQGSRRQPVGARDGLISASFISYLGNRWG